MQIKFNKTMRLFTNLINFKVSLCDTKYKIQNNIQGRSQGFIGGGGGKLGQYKFINRNFSAIEKNCIANF